MEDAAGADDGIPERFRARIEEEEATKNVNPTPTEVFRDLLSLLYKYRPNLFRDPVGCVRLVLSNLARSGAPTGICLVLAVVTIVCAAFPIFFCLLQSFVSVP